MSATTDDTTSHDCDLVRCMGCLRLDRVAIALRGDKLRCEQCGCDTLLNIATIEPYSSRKCEARPERATTVATIDSAAVARLHHRMIPWKYRDVPEPRIAPSRDLPAVRLREFERYLCYRYGSALPDDDAGRCDLTILLNMLARLGGPEGISFRMRAVAKVWSRDRDTNICWIDDGDLDKLVGSIIARPRRYTAKKLGEMTRLTEQEHAMLGITSLWAHTWNEAEVRADQKQRRQARDREAKKAKRAANSSGRRRGRPKKEGIPAWQAAGFKSERTYYRHKASGETPRETQKVAEKMCRLYKKDSYRGDGISLPRAPTIIIPASALDLDNCDFRQFGITSIQIMSGNNLISAWTAPPSPVSFVGR
jgi:hypothetical protein